MQHKWWLQKQDRKIRNGISNTTTNKNILIIALQHEVIKFTKIHTFSVFSKWQVEKYYYNIYIWKQVPNIKTYIKYI